MESLTKTRECDVILEIRVTLDYDVGRLTTINVTQCHQHLLILLIK